MDEHEMSELRQDLVSGDWIVIARGRSKRPHINSSPRNTAPLCPFEDPQTSGNGEPLLVLFQSGKEPIRKNWAIQVITNKFPAFKKTITPLEHVVLAPHSNLNNACVIELREGPHTWVPGYGYHEVIIYRDHTKPLSRFSILEAAQVFEAYQARYLAIARDKCVKYILILHNHGRESGASLDHPHSQLIAIPVVPPDVMRSLEGSRRYRNEHKKCVHCVMLEWELKDKKRIVYENDHFVSVCPYVSRASFEIRIFPKLHAPHFEKMPTSSFLALAEVFTKTLEKLDQALGTPHYNFFIHTAPTQGNSYDHYHWHIELIPKTGIWGGFEIGTGIEVSSVAPETAAETLRAAAQD